MTIQAFMSKYPASAGLLPVLLNQVNNAAGTTISVAPRSRAPGPSVYRWFTVIATAVSVTLMSDARPYCWMPVCVFIVIPPRLQRNVLNGWTFVSEHNVHILRNRIKTRSNRSSVIEQAAVGCSESED